LFKEIENNLKTKGWHLFEGIVPANVMEFLIKECEAMESRFIKDWHKNKPSVKFDVTKFPPMQRLRPAWLAFEQPQMRRMPFRNLITENFHKFVTNKIFTDIARQLLSTKDIALFGGYNLRPKIKEQSWNVTPPHADFQAWRETSENNVLTSPSEAMVLTFWTPLCKVNKNKSCLRISEYKLSLSDQQYLIKEGISIEESSIMGNLNFTDIEMSPTDLLIFDHQVVHCSNPNNSDEVVWVMDWRYQKQKNL